MTAKKSAPTVVVVKKVSKVVATAAPAPAPAATPAAAAPAAAPVAKVATVRRVATPAATDGKTVKTVRKAVTEPAAAPPSTTEPAPKKKPARAAKAAPAAKSGPKAKSKGENLDDADLSDIDSDLEGEPEVAETTETTATVEKVKPLRMKISKAKERALMKEFGLDETVLSEEEAQSRRNHLKALIKLGKTRGYLTHGEINDHLPDKLVEAETLEVVISLLNDMGVAVYEQTPDAETLLLNNTGPTAATEEEAEEEAEAALSTVDSEFGRTTDPVRMYMREMGTVELLTREGEIEIAKRIEGG
ncbi:MAG: RNA polymerase sigma factor RpoD, partial [Polaromonas sp.]|nr:RNA polymerase sigma factor RpoD [Polaromonas sp.]